MAFIGLRAAKINSENLIPTMRFSMKSKVIHFNPNYIKWVNENTMTLCLDDDQLYRIDEESLLVFLNAMYGENKEYSKAESDDE